MQHPKRVFMRNAIEFEIRLSYHDRILKTLPEPMQNPDNRLLPSEAPGPDYEYDDPGALCAIEGMDEVITPTFQLAPTMTPLSPY